MQLSQKSTQDELLTKAYQLQCQFMNQTERSAATSPPPKRLITQRIAEWENQLQEQYSLTSNRANKEVPFPGTQFDDIPTVCIDCFFVM